MRHIGLVVIALGMVSISSQGMVSFADFVGGHNLAAKMYKVTGSSDSKFNNLMPNHNLFIAVNSGNVLRFEGPCTSYTKYPNEDKPTGAWLVCEKDKKYLQDFVANLLFLRKSAGSEFWNAPNKGSFTFKGNSKWLTLTRVK